MRVQRWRGLSPDGCRTLGKHRRGTEWRTSAGCCARLHRATSKKEGQGTAAEAEQLLNWGKLRAMRNMSVWELACHSQDDKGRAQNLRMLVLPPSVSLYLPFLLLLQICRCQWKIPKPDMGLMQMCSLEIN